jgi:hypothetical protein
LEARIAFRKAWALRVPPLKPPNIKWELAYDAEYNFARMGAEYVDEKWGRLFVSPVKPKKRFIA